MAENVQGNWITLSRSIQQHWIWEHPLYLKWWIDLIMLAEWRDTLRVFSGRSFNIRRGQLVASINYLQKRWQYHEHGVKLPARKTVLRFLRLLESQNMILRNTHYVSNRETLITICNYVRYQQNLEVSETTEDTTKAPCNYPTVYTSEDTSTITTEDTTQGIGKVAGEGREINNITNKQYIDVVDVVVEEPAEKNQKWLKQFFENPSTLEFLTKELQKDNPAIQNVEEIFRLGQTVITEWNITGQDHKDYKGFSKHLINQLRKKNRENATNKKNNSRPGSSGSSNRRDRSNDVELIE